MRHAGECRDRAELKGYKSANLLLVKPQQEVEMLIADFSLNFVCPKCRAQPKEQCRVSDGTSPNASHVDRWAIASGYLNSVPFCVDSPFVRLDRKRNKRSEERRV